MLQKNLMPILESVALDCILSIRRSLSASSVAWLVSLVSPLPQDLLSHNLLIALADSPVVNHPITQRTPSPGRAETRDCATGRDLLHRFDGNHPLLLTKGIWNWGSGDSEIERGIPLVAAHSSLIFPLLRIYAFLHHPDACAPFNSRNSASRLSRRA
jgi:hypothetical protein